MEEECDHYLKLKGSENLSFKPEKFRRSKRLNTTDCIQSHPSQQKQFYYFEIGFFRRFFWARFLRFLFDVIVHFLENIFLFLDLFSIARCDLTKLVLNFITLRFFNKKNHIWNDLIGSQ